MLQISTEHDLGLRKIIKLIDQVASKGIIHKNKANNKKSKLSKLLNKK